MSELNFFGWIVLIWWWACTTYYFSSKKEIKTRGSIATIIIATIIIHLALLL